MSRKKRIWYPGATYHVMSRGNRRTTLFKEQSDYMRFLECVAISRKQYSFRIHVCFKKNEISFELHHHLGIIREKND